MVIQPTRAPLTALCLLIKYSKFSTSPPPLFSMRSNKLFSVMRRFLSQHNSAATWRVGRHFLCLSAKFPQSRAWPLFSFPAISLVSYWVPTRKVSLSPSALLPRVTLAMLDGPVLTDPLFPAFTACPSSTTLAQYLFKICRPTAASGLLSH